MITEFIERTDQQVILPAEVLAETLSRIGNNIGKEVLYSPVMQRNKKHKPFINKGFPL